MTWDRVCSSGPFVAGMSSPSSMPYSSRTRRRRAPRDPCRGRRSAIAGRQRLRCSAWPPARSRSAGSTSSSVRSMRRSIRRPCRGGPVRSASVDPSCPNVAGSYTCRRRTRETSRACCVRSVIAVNNGSPQRPGPGRCQDAAQVAGQGRAFGSGRSYASHPRVPGPAELDSPDQLWLAGAPMRPLRRCAIGGWLSGAASRRPLASVPVRRPRLAVSERARHLADRTP
jgi:hypothetical protein